ERLHDGSRKTIALSEVLPLTEKGDYRTQDIFVFTPVTKDEDGHILGYHAPTGIIPNFVARARAYGFSDLDESFFDPATYGVPAPPSFAAGESYSVRWAPSLKHRERGEPDPSSFKKEWQSFEQRLKDEAHDARGDKPPTPASAPVQVQVPANLPTMSRSPEPAPARPKTAEAPAAVRNGPALRPNQAAHNRPAPPVPDDDRTPPPTRNPFASEADDGLGAPDEPKVQVSADLLADGDETQGRGVPPPRPGRPASPPPRPGGPSTGQRPALAAPARPPARPASPPARPPPPVPDDEDDALPELDDSEKTNIRPMPEKPRR
ncbi:MAG TPA: CpaF family protein, partial [Archangium sp.]